MLEGCTPILDEGGLGNSCGQGSGGDLVPGFVGICIFFSKFRNFLLLPLPPPSHCFFVLLQDSRTIFSFGKFYTFIIKKFKHRKKWKELCSEHIPTI